MAYAIVDRVAHVVDGQGHPSWRRIVRRRDRVEPWLERIESLDEGFGVGPQVGELLEHAEHVERRHVAVRVLALGQRLGLGTSLAARDQHLDDGLVADRKVARGADGGDHKVDQRRAVAWE